MCEFELWPKENLQEKKYSFTCKSVLTKTGFVYFVVAALYLSTGNDTYKSTTEDWKWDVTH